MSLAPVFLDGLASLVPPNSKVFDLGMRPEGDFDTQAALDSINPLKAGQSLFLARILTNLEHRLEATRSNPIPLAPSLLDQLNEFLVSQPTLSILAQVVKEHSLELPKLAQALGCDSAVVNVDIDLSLENALKGQNPVNEISGQLTLKWK